MRRLLLLLLAAGLGAVIVVGCNRRPRKSTSPAPSFPPEAIQQVVEAEKNPQAALQLLNETLKDWVLRRNQLPQDASEFVTAGMLPRLPVAPPGKRFALDPQQKRFVLADQ